MTGICSVCGIKLMEPPKQKKKEEPWEVFLKLPGINEEYARALANAGFNSMNDLARSNVGDIEKVLNMNSRLAELVHEEAKNQAIFLCGNCGAFLSPEATVCPICGAIVYSEDETAEKEEEEIVEKTASEESEAPLYMCPACGAFISPDSASCPHCGAIFEGEEKLDGGEKTEEVIAAPKDNIEETPAPEIVRKEETPVAEAKKTSEKSRMDLEEEERINRELMEKLQSLEEGTQEDNNIEEVSVLLPDEKEDKPQTAHVVALDDSLVICGNCGAIIPSGELVCPKCGVELIYGKKAETEEEAGEDEIKRFFGLEGADLSKYSESDGTAGALYICSHCGAFYPEEAERCLVCGTAVSDMEKKIPDYEQMLSLDIFPQDEGVSICDVCGAFVPLDKDVCPVCGADMAKHRYLPSKIPTTELGYEVDVEKFFGPLMEVMREEKKEEAEELYICRACGAFMGKGAEECPICGAKYGEDRGEFNICPLCGAKVPVNITVCPICSTQIGAEIAEEGVEELEALEKIVSEEEGPEINEVIGSEVIEKFMRTVDTGEDFFADTREKEPEEIEDPILFADEGTEKREPGTEAEEETEEEEFEELNWEDIVGELNKLEVADEEMEEEWKESDEPDEGILEETVEEVEIASEPEESLEDFMVYEEEEQEDYTEDEVEEEGILEVPEPLDIEEAEPVLEGITEKPEPFSTEYEGTDYEIPVEDVYGVQEEYAQAEEEFEPAVDEAFVPAEFNQSESDYEEAEEWGEEEAPEEYIEEEIEDYEEEEEEPVEESAEVRKPAQARVATTKPLKSQTPQRNRAKTPVKIPVSRRKHRYAGKRYMDAREGLLFFSLIPAIIILFTYDFIPRIYVVRITLVLLFSAVTAAGLWLLLLPGERGWPSRLDTLLMVLSGVAASVLLLKWYLPLTIDQTVLNTVASLGAGALGVYAGSRIRGRGYFLAWLIGSVFMTIFTAVNAITGPWDNMTVKLVGGFGLAYMMGGGIILVRIKWGELLVENALKSGDNSYLEKDYGRAVRAYEKVINMSNPENNPDYDIPWYSKGAALISLGRFEEAIESLDRAIEINPLNEVTWNNKGNALSRLGRHEEAIDCYDRALKINPNYEVAWNNKGNAYARVGRLQDALKCYDKAIMLNEDYREAWINKGYVLVKLGMYDEAVECANRIIPDKIHKRRTSGA